MALFMNRQAVNNLMPNELKAVQQFLSSYVTPFYPDRLREIQIEKLVENSEVLNIESDMHAFTHKTDEFALFKPNVKRAKGNSLKITATTSKRNPLEKKTEIGTAREMEEI